MRRNQLSLTEGRNTEGKVGGHGWKERGDKNAFIHNLETFAKAAAEAQLTYGNAKWEEICVRNPGFHSLCLLAQVSRIWEFPM